MRSVTEITEITDELVQCETALAKLTERHRRARETYDESRAILEERVRRLLAERIEVGREKMKAVLAAATEPTPIIAYVVKRPDRLYHYAAIRVGERWYTTGHDTPRGGYTPDGLLDSLSQGGGYLVAGPLLLKAGEGA